MDEKKNSAVNSAPILVRLIKMLFSFYPVMLPVALACILFNAIISSIPSIFMQNVISLVEQSWQAGDWAAVGGQILRFVLILVVLYVLSLAAGTVFSQLMAIITQGSLAKMREKMFNGMQDLPIKYFDTHNHGDVMSYYTNDIDTLRQMLGQATPQIINSTITMAATLVTMIFINPALTVISIVTAIVMLVVTKNFSRISGKYYMRQQRDLGVVDGFIEEMLDGQKVVKVFCHEEQAKADFRQVNQALRDSADKANRYANLLMPINANIGWLSYAVVAIVGAILAINGMAGVTLGTVISFVGLNKSFTNPITQVSQQVNFVVTAAAGAGRVFDLMDEVPETDEGYVELVNAREGADGSLHEADHRTNVWAWKHPHKAEGTVTYTRLEGSVVFEHVDFGYDPGKLVLHDISLWAKPGQKIAFVGATGAGKTTITNLINRFYDIADGKIRYDGINIGKIKKDDLRRSLGIVLQDTHLFTGTVMDNIRYGNLEASDEECMAAAQLANADGFIRRLPDGYQTMLTGDGANLSQGQRQLLAIARAAVADPPVLILDEATSSIDTRTEKLVQDGMDALMTGRTTFVIAHRLSTVRNSDCIMVMEQGRIIERGTHDELIEKKGKYYQLYTGNFAEEPA